jgi:Kelch motif
MKCSIALISLLLSNAAAQTPGTFSAAGKMITPRVYHTATLLLNGKVLIAGGQALWGGSYLASAELYDPKTGTFTATGDMTVPRHLPIATLLPSGQVLIVSADTGAEIYDPSTGAFTPVTYLASANTNCSAATLLANGKVLINVGTVWPGPRGLGVTAQLYDPASGTFAATNRYSDFPQTTFFPCPLATLLPDGKVLTTWNESEAELYDPDTASFRLTQGWVNDYDGVYTATLLTTGKVLITTETNTELYDPKTETFAVTGAPPTYSIAALLSDGTVLFTGGCQGLCDPLKAGAEFYDPTSGKFTATGGLTTPRYGHTATLLRDGTVVIAGGVKASFLDSVPIATAEIYTPVVTRSAPVILQAADGQAAILHGSTEQPVSPEKPAVGGEALEIYATGLIESGRVPPQVFIGGLMAEVLYFGNAPGYPTLNQVNVRLPSGISAGPAVPVRLIYLNRPSNEVTISLQ